MAQGRGDQNQSPWLHRDPKAQRESSRQRSETRGAENQWSTLPGPQLGEGRKHIWKAALGGRGTDPTGSSEKSALKCKAGTAPLISGWRGALTRPSQPALGEFLAKEGSWAGRSGLREWNTHVPTAGGIETALLSSRALPSHPRPVSAQKRDFAKKPVPEDSHCLKTCVFLEHHSFLEREQTLSPPLEDEVPRGAGSFSFCVLPHKAIPSLVCSDQRAGIISARGTLPSRTEESQMAPEDHFSPERSCSNTCNPFW